ncbi:MAG TPA: hypothetical protein VKE88_00640 [Candidatus Nanoarchaeia archaeon]|nr:hypothetical protein [Candidatus Nanoarchaeia archaeon]
MKNTCEGCVCRSCKGVGQIIGGAALIATAIYWPANVWVVFGSLIALKGLLKITKPSCMHCK